MRAQNKGVCSEAGCEAKALTRRMCNKHYRRAFKAGKFEPVFGLPVALRLERSSKINLDTGCVEWTGPVGENGYGKIGIGLKTKSPHRIIWEEVYGPIPKGLCVLHRCDNRACMNIAHLFLGTIADNHKDMDAKGRRCVLRGDDNGAAKLTEEQALQIRADYRTLKEIAGDYGISFSHAGAIRRGDRWGHLKNKCMEAKNA